MTFRSALLAAATISYPAIVYLLLRNYGFQALAIPICVIAVLRIVLKRDWLWGGGLLALGAVTLLTRQSLPAKFYPVAVNASLLVSFGYSLLHPPSAVERVARLREPSLPPRAQVYTRHVTQVWCVFFVVNGGIAAWLALNGTDAQWALFCGGISYAAAGLLFAGEFLVRLYLKRNWRDG